MPDFSAVLHELSILIVPMLLAVVVHEVSHGYAAYLMGDPTAKQAGRLTLNPLSHLDLFGTLAFALTRMIGWAKPVPIDPRYFKNPRRGMMLVSLAGPGSNFLLAALSAQALRLVMYVYGLPGALGYDQILMPLGLMAKASVQLNLALGLFNLLPVPPLDGSKVLAFFLPPRLAYQYESFERYGLLVLLALLWFNVVQQIIGPPLILFYNLLMPR